MFWLWIFFVAMATSAFNFDDYVQVVTEDLFDDPWERDSYRKYVEQRHEMLRSAEEVERFEEHILAELWNLQALAGTEGEAVSEEEYAFSVQLVDEDILQF